MLVAKEFVFVHVPKTGGTFVGTCMRTSMPVLDLGMHGYYRHLPDEYKHLPAICFSRNPWDWYVSLWHQRQRQGQQETLLELLESCFAKTPDHYSRLFGQIAGVGGVRENRVAVGEFERLREDFVAFLDRHQIMAPGLREKVGMASPENVSQRDRYRSYYDDRTRELVGRCRLARRYEF